VKIALFHNDKNRDPALAAGKIITSQSCIVEYHDTEKIWDREYCLNPLKLLEKATHALFIPSQDERDMQPFYFLAGFCLGKGIQVIVLETGKNLSLPENIRHLCIFLTPESFEDFFVSEKVRYYKEDKRNRARIALLEQGISCFEENFIFVVNSGDVEAVALFIDAGFDASLVDGKGTPLLSLAVRARYPDIVRRLLDAGADVNRRSDDRGYSPLMDAAQKGDVEMAEILLGKGADPDLRSKDGQTALIISAGRNDEKMAALLVAHHADPSIVDNLGMSARTYAQLFKKENLLALFNAPSA